MPHAHYTTASKLLHQLVLGVPFVGKACFELETIINSQRHQPQVQSPVFITGLARSGTTVLLESLYMTGQFRSLTYRDMPFVLMSSLWSKLARPFYAKSTRQERAHGDGVVLDYDSPEAFEEVFWQLFCGKEYIEANSLKPHQPDDSTIERFRQFALNTLASNAKNPPRYLSKNNNNILRLAALQKAFPDATIIIPFRDPIQQALSLHRQHMLFIERHEQDAFSRKYMDWLGHFEFGSNHKPFAFSSVKHSKNTPENLEYWLEYWIHVHQYLLEFAPNACTFLSYDQLCKTPQESCERLWKAVGLGKIDVEAVSAHFKSHQHPEPTISDQLKAEAYSLYHALEKRAL